MRDSGRILWGEGLFLRPQHFQQQDAYHEARLHATAHAIQPYAWGLRHARFDTDALASGILRVTELSLLFPDGEWYCAPQGDDLPAPLALNDLPAGISESVFHLALHPMRAGGVNYREASDGAPTSRFVGHQLETADLFTEAKPAAITYLRAAVKLVADGEPRDQFVSLPIVRVRRSATGNFQLDENFLAPSLAINASAVLHQRLRRLLDALQAKVNALYGFHREPSRNIIEFRSGDIASFWLLHTANASFAALSHLYHHPETHPERLFQEMLRMAGALMTFSKAYTLADIPVYDHRDPGEAFAQLDTMVRELLDTVISTRYFAIALAESRPSFHLGRLDSGKIDDKTRFYLSVSADMPTVELVEAIPSRFKVGAPDDVDKLVLSSMPGVPLVYTPQVPAAIPVRPGACYFTVEARGPLYERMMQAGTITIYTPAGIRELKLELIAVTS